MATLRDIKRKIGAVKKTQSITRAMNGGGQAEEYAGKNGKV